jgi:hypothetical protein
MPHPGYFASAAKYCIMQANAESNSTRATTLGAQLKKQRLA